MSQTKFGYPLVYNPSNHSEDEIISNFVVRIKEFKDLFDAIKKDKMKTPPQHYIIQGQRGYGKTTLLLRLNLEIRNNTQTQKWLIPVMFEEEQYGIRTLAKLWEEVIYYLADKYDCFSEITTQIDLFYEKEFPEEELLNHLVSCLNKKKKKLILFMDNFGELIQKFNKKEIQRLREVLNTSNVLRIIGASAKQLEFTYSYKHSFYEFFKIISLNELNKEDSILLLKRLAETYNQSEEINKIIIEQPERIESLLQLTGGVPRTIILLFKIILDNKNGDSFKDLEEILDRVTPFYKDRLDNLSDQQQTIIDAIAQNWDAMSTKEIAQKVRMPSKAVSSQLNLLEKNQIVTKIQSSTKNHLYRISERFFNIYYLMRVGNRRSKNRVLSLVNFFKAWYSKVKSTEKIQFDVNTVQDINICEKNEYYLSTENEYVNTFSSIKSLLLKDKIDEAITECRNFFNSKHKVNEYFEELTFLLLMFLAKKQYNFIYKIFQNSEFELKDKYKPIYYAAVSLLGVSYSDEFKKMPPEIKETVDDVLKKIKQLEIDYA